MIRKEILKQLVEAPDFLGIKENIGYLDRIDALETLLTFNRAQVKGTEGFYTVVLNKEGVITVLGVISVYTPRGIKLGSYTLDGVPIQGDAALENLLKLGV